LIALPKWPLAELNFGRLKRSLHALGIVGMYYTPAGVPYLYTTIFHLPRAGRLIPLLTAGKPQVLNPPNR